MSRQSDALTSEIAVAEKAMLRAEESGRPVDALIAGTRAQALRWAEWLLFGDALSCTHVRHHWVGKTAAGVNVWECNDCPETYPPGAEVVA